MIESSALGTATALLSYMHPSKSPFYGVVAAGAISSILICSEKLTATAHWLALLLPIFIVLALSLVLSFSIRPNFSKTDYLDSLRFSRSIGISVGLLALAITARATDTDNTAFLVAYLSCLIQILTFVAYSYARSKKDESDEHDLRINYVQFSLITSTLLIAASYCNTQYVTAIDEAEKNQKSIVDFEKEYEQLEDTEGYEAKNLKEEIDEEKEVFRINKVESPRYLTTGILLYLLWIFCLFFWLNYLRKIVRFTIAIPLEEASTTKTKT